MVHQEVFSVEEWFDTYEPKCEINIGETCCASLSLNEISKIIDKPLEPVLEKISNLRLTYGPISGSKELRSAVAGIYNETGESAKAQFAKFGISDSQFSQSRIGADNVLVSNGAIGANYLVYYALLGPGDHVIVTDPIYQQLRSVPKMFGAEIELLPLEKDPGTNSEQEGGTTDVYRLNLEALKKMLKPNTKMVILNSPHNPTGSHLTTAELKEIVDIVKVAPRNSQNELQPPYIHCDEVYRPVFLDDEADWPLSIIHLYERGISTSSATKAYGMAGVRVGWVAARDKQVLVECMAKRHYNTISVSQVDDTVTTWALQEGGWRKILNHHLTQTVRPNVELLMEWVKSSNGAVRCPRPTAGTVVLIEFVGVTETISISKEIILDHSTMLAPGETFNRPGTVRVGFANSPKDLKLGLEEIKKVLVKHRFVPKPWNM